MDERQVTKILVAELESWMSSEGFNRRAGENLFERLQDDRVEEVVPTLVRWSSADYWDIHLHLHIRYPEIESLLNAHRPYLSVSQAERTVTVRGFLDELAKDGNELEPVSVVLSGDIPEALPVLLERLGTYGLLFFHRWSSLTKLRRGYEQESAMWPERDPIRRLENLLTLYAIQADRAAFDAQAPEALSFMAEHRGGFYLQPFEGIVLGLSRLPGWRADPATG
jgi:hypothetical protein